MTRITYKHYPGFYSMEIKGHSGYSVAGTDIVCSAISIIAMGLADRLLSHKLCATVHISLPGGGEFKAEVIDISDKDGRIDECFEFACDSLKMLADNYPYHVEYKEESFDSYPTHM